jgi:tRNA 2-thiouridine synthesizing protein A
MTGLASEIYLCERVRRRRADPNILEYCMYSKWFQLFHRSHTKRSLPPSRLVEVPGIGQVRVARTIDCIGESCLRPQLLTIKTLGQLQDGEVLELIFDNPSSVEGIHALITVLEVSHLGTVKDKGHWSVYICNAS